jgi:hypothetical protein
VDGACKSPKEAQAKAQRMDIPSYLQQTVPVAAGLRGRERPRRTNALIKGEVMGIRRSGALGAVAAAALSVLGAGTALAVDCTNASKPAGAGVQVIIGPDDEIEWTTRGVAVRIDHGLIDSNTGEGFHGLIGFDVDGDGKADVSTYVVTPNSALPEVAQINGAACHGIVPIEDLFPGGACFSG